MERYIGIDVHASSSTCCVLKASGKQLRRDVVETNGKALIGYLKQIAGNLHLCIEEAEWSQWLVEILTPHVAEIVIVRKPWRPGAKNDALDAHDLAEQICRGRFECQVYKDPKRFTALRDLARAYIMVTRDRARTKNRIKSFFRGRGIACRTGAIFSPEGQAKARRGLPAATRQAVALLSRELELLTDLKCEAEKAMLRASHRHAIARQLETAPGMGPIRVAQLLPVVVTPHRFRAKRQFWAYCGFGVVTRTSADWTRQDGCWVRAKVNRTRGLNFNHNELRIRMACNRHTNP